MSLTGQIDENYDYQKCLAFIEDIADVLSKSNLIALFKIKKFKESQKIYIQN